MSNLSGRDLFEVWLIDMDDALSRFLSMLSNECASQLNFLPESLLALERILLDRYADVPSALLSGESRFVDGAARYVGEVYRKSQGGKWTIDFSDPKNVFYGRPQLVGMAGQVAQISPLSLVTASLDRRTGTFIFDVFKNLEG